MLTTWPMSIGAIAPPFVLPLNDSGAGAVNTALVRGAGAATFTRATAAASRLSTGLWKLDVATGVARSHYHDFTPGSGVYTYGGYLSEPAATQLALLPRDMTNAAWVKGATMTVAQTGTGIDGVVNSCTRLTAGAVGATNTVLQTLTAAASTRTYSCFIRRVTGTGTITISQGATTLDVTASLVTTGFVLVQLAASVLNVAFGITMATNGDVILVDCNQFEAGAVATTPIPAAGARNADVLQYVYAGNADTAQGTAYAEIATLCPGANAPANQIVFAVGVGGFPLYQPTGQVYTRIDSFDTTNSATKTGLASTVTGVRKRASSWGAAGLAVTGDGLSVATGTFDGVMGTNANIQIGAGNSLEQFSGTIKNARLWNTQLSNAQVQGLSDG